MCISLHFHCLAGRAFSCTLLGMVHSIGMPYGSAALQHFTMAADLRLKHFAISRLFYQQLRDKTTARINLFMSSTLPLKEFPPMPFGE